MTKTVAIGLFLMWIPVFCANLAAAEGTAADEGAEKSAEEQRRDTIRYGTDNEIASLIRTLKTEEAYYLDDELIRLAGTSSNRSILSALFSFFGERGREGLEERALRAVSLQYDDANETILAAADYLGNVKAGEAVEALERLIDGEERRFLNTAFRSLGKIGGGNPDKAEGIAEYLIGFYTNRDVDDENRREIIVALGETGSRAGTSFLTDIAAGNNEEGAGIRMAALNALSKIGDPEGLKVIVDSVSSQDPNIRSTAVSALGPFNSPETDQAILDAFRDTYYRTRLAAAQAAGKRKMEAAVPYLSYRAERDDVPQVKDEAIRALGAIGNAGAMRVLDTLFSERKNADRVRILSAEMLIRENPDRYAVKVITELDEAKKRNQTTLYNGLLRVISTAKTRAVEDLVGRFFAAGGVVEKSYAMDMAANNGFKNFTAQIEALTDEKNGSLSRKARATLERLDRGPEPAPDPAASGESARPAESSSPQEPSPQAPPAESPDTETPPVPQPPGADGEEPVGDDPGEQPPALPPPESSALPSAMPSVSPTPATPVDSQN